MSDERITSDVTLREELITTAVKFLTNPNVQRSSLQKKENFLRSKGLTDFEIKAALDRGKELLSQLPAISSKSEFMVYRTCNSNRLKDAILSAVVVGAVTYGVYWLYKRYLEEYLFGSRTKQKNLDASIVELKKTLEEHITSLKTEVARMRTDLERINSHNSSNNVVRSQIEGLKSDIASVKGLLLSRNQFPSVASRSEPPSIPAWQIQSAQATSEKVAKSTSAEDEISRPKVGPMKRSRGERSESGGSNSSEGEAATKNSDSSLEIIT